MSDHHHHHHHGHIPRLGADSKNISTSLKAALIITASVFVIELFGGIWTGSLALLGDAGHMFMDVSALSLSLFAFWFSRRQPSEASSFGYYRIEILAALINGVALLVMVGWILYEAFERFTTPTDINPEALTAIAFIGLLANLISAKFLSESQEENLNVRGAYLHVIMDALGSVGVLISGVVIWITGWTLIDPLVSIFICCLLLYGSWGLISDSVKVLMQFTPSHLDVEEMKKRFCETSGVKRVSDLHTWTLTSGLYALSSHIQVEENADRNTLICELEKIAIEEFQISHTTFQLNDHLRDKDCVLEFNKGEATQG